MHPQHCDLGERRVSYTDSGEGSAVVFAHAMMLDQTMWTEVLAHLPPGLRTITYDLRGHGGSSVPQMAWSMGALVRDAEQLLDHLDLRDCVFVGASLGGMVAQGLAVKRLDLLRGLVLSNTAAKIGTRQGWDAMLAEVRKTGLMPRLDRDMEQMFSAPFRADPKALQWRKTLAAADLDTWLGCGTAIAGTDFYTTTASLRLPTLVIASDRDAITPTDLVRETAELIPGHKFQMIRGAGHLPAIEKPKDFAQVLGDFLRSIGHIQNSQNST